MQRFLIIEGNKVELLLKLFVTKVLKGIIVAFIQHLYIIL